MTFEWGKYLSVFLGSMVKFIFGPTTGIGWGLSIMETTIFTTLGMMASVLIFTEAGAAFRVWYLRRFPAKNKKFTKSNRRFVLVWKRFGVSGVSFLTPLIFTPIGGALLASSVGAPKRKVYAYMFLSGFLWALFFSFIFKFFFPNGLSDIF